MRSHDDATAQRVSRILDAARGSALAGAERRPDRESPADQVWPASWPPGYDAGAEVDQAGVAPDESGRIAVSFAGGPRWAVSARAAAVVGAVALLVIAVVVVLLLRGPAPGPVVPARDPASFSGVPPATPGPTGASAVLGATPAGGVAGEPAALPSVTAQPSAGGVRVYVVGQVRRPGVVSLADGARVEDAIDAAGGSTARADLTVMNLARKVIDGERILVPRPGQKVPTDDPAPVDAGAAAGSGAAAGTPVPGSPVDLNTATEADLDALPGVGPVLAGRIVAWWQQNGGFKTVDDLGEVSGIGDATLARLRPLVRV